MSKEVFSQVVTFCTTPEQAAAIDALAKRLAYGNRSDVLRRMVALCLDQAGIAAAAPRQQMNGAVEHREAV